MHRATAFVKRLHSISTQLFLIFFVSMLVPITIGGYLSYKKSTSIVEKQVSAVAQQTINQLSDKINFITKKYEDISMILMYSQAIQKAIEPDSLDTEYDKEKQRTEALRLISSMMTNSPELLHIYVFDDKKKYSVFDSINERVDHWQTGWYKSILEADGRPVWFGVSDKSYISETDMGIPVFAMGRTLRNVETGRVIGVIFIEIRGNILAKEVNAVRFAQKGFAYIADANHKYVYHPNNIFNGVSSDFPLYDQIDKFTYRQKSYLEIPSVLENGWRVNGIVPVQELVGESLQIRSMTITIAFVSIFWALTVGFFISRKISLPLIHLCKLMKRSESGDLSARSHITGKNELGQLGLSFNKMNEKIQALINRVAEKEAEKKKAEIRALRYQINPHFLYNTLNSIRWMAKLGKTHDVANAVTNLVYLLESSIERKGLFVPLGEEIELLEKYMVIQQYRYGNQLTMQIHCPEHLKQIMIPRMLLQPIVENSIFHGIAPKEEPGNIDISITEDGSNIVVCIDDDGIGIPKEKLPELMKMKDNESRTRGMTRIGLSHVDQTLKLYYGRDAGVAVHCAPGIGTTVRLVFGKQQNGEEFSHVQSVVS